jgi:mRNA interferase RelE/StbE
MWKIQYTQKAAKTIKKLNPSIQQNIKKGIDLIRTNPEIGKQLKGSLKGLRSLRHGEYRIIYKKESSQLIILIVAIGHRKNIYS